MKFILLKNNNLNSRNEWQYLVDRFSLNDRTLGTLIPKICETFHTQERLKEVNKLFFITIYNFQ